MVRRRACLVEHAGDRAVLVIAAALDTDQVRVVTGVDRREDAGGLELLAVPGARDVARGRLVGERCELTDDECDYCERSRAGTSEAHCATMPQTRLDCTYDDAIGTVKWTLVPLPGSE